MSDSRLELQELLDLNLNLVDAPALALPRREILVGCLTVILQEIERLGPNGQKAVLSAITYSMFESVGLSTPETTCPMCD